jgi:ectoine hydroxylase-related dioxygenase (phytanoyl-CoA dioxygenase family)
MSAPAINPFYIANALLCDRDALKNKFREDGYIFLKAIVPPHKLIALKRQITNICFEHGWLKPGSDPMSATAWTSPKVEGEEEYFEVYDKIQKLESFHALPHTEEILAVMRLLLDETAFPHPLSIARLMFPHIPEWTTPPHQDYPNNQGTKELYACWLPLGDCPRAMGGLSILPGSHRLGLLPRAFALGPGHRKAVIDDRLAALEWAGSDFETGDLIVFNSLTVHRSLPNTTDRLRLSVDYRFQREGDALTEACLAPHFNRMDWHTIYRNWQDERLKYYWKNKRFTISTWDSQLQELPPSHMADALRQLRAFNIRRTQLKECYEGGPEAAAKNMIDKGPSDYDQPTD